MKRRAAGLLAAVLVSTLAACQSEQPAPPAYEPIHYVALGDSFTAAPLVPTTDTSDACLRSDGNYPHLVAMELPQVRLTDVSCSGADTASMTQPQSIGGQTKPPQLDAVTDETDLVTIGIGGNDFRLFGAMSIGCFQVTQTDADGAPCRESNQEAGGDHLLDLVPRIQRRVRGVIQDVRERAPDATVVVVGYPRLLPPSGTCRKLVPLAAGDYAYFAELNKAVSDALLAAAEKEGVDSVDVYAASRGHDICSDAPWVNGIVHADEALAMHPFPEEQQAVADLILDQL